MQFCTMLTPQQIFKALEARRKELDISQAELGARAFGVSDNSAMQALRRGSSPAADKLEALCRAVGWEFYFGPPRDANASEGSARSGVGIALTPAISGILGEDPSDTRRLVHIPVFEAALAAGNGVPNDDVRMIDHLAFRRDWLERMHIKPAQAVLARARGESMLPAIHPGDMLLIDRSRNEVPVRRRRSAAARSAPVYALVDGDGARVKRIERPAANVVVLLSDNPDFAPEVLTGPEISGLNIIGRVVWWAHAEHS